MNVEIIHVLGIIFTLTMCRSVSVEGDIILLYIYCFINRFLNCNNGEVPATESPSSKWSSLN